MPPLEVVVLKGPSEGTVFSLTGRDSISLGRSPGNDLVLRDAKVSSHHARLDVGPTGIVLTDLGSKNGTFIGADQITGSRGLDSGTTVRIGDSEIVVRQSAPVAPRRRPRVRALPTESTRDLVLEPATHPGAPNVTKVQRNLAVLHGVGALLSSVREVDRFLESLMDLIFDTLPADRGSLMLVDRHGETTPAVMRQSRDSADEELAVPRTILNKVIDDGVSILTADAGSDARLAEGSSIIAQNIRSAMCVPIRGKERCLGVIYVDTTLTVGVFGEDDLHLLSTVGILAGTALENIELFDRNLAQERMAAIGKVIAGLGHDIRNMLTALKGGVYLLDDLLLNHENDTVREAWQILRRGQESIATLVQDMVNYTKPREPEWQLASVNDAVQLATSFAAERARSRKVGLREEFDDRVETFYFDPRGLERCVMNLLTNAIDATKVGEGEVTVATSWDPEGPAVTIVISDNGKGIPESQKEKVFDLLYSTKGSRGAGFGLAITKKIVEEHGGEITLDSTPGTGTKFSIRLPVRTTPPESEYDDYAGERTTPISSESED